MDKVAYGNFKGLSRHSNSSIPESQSVLQVCLVSLIVYNGGSEDHQNCYEERHMPARSDTAAPDSVIKICRSVSRELLP